MLQKIRDVDINRSKANFTFEIKDAQEFLDSGKRRGSEFFHCRSMQFYLQMQKVRWEEDDYLAAFLTRFNPSDSYDYSMRTNYTLVLHNFSNKPEKVHQGECKFEKGGEGDERGAKNFIRISELIDTANGWIQEDTIRLQVRLKCHEFRRIL